MEAVAAQTRGRSFTRLEPGNPASRHQPLGHWQCHGPAANALQETNPLIVAMHPAALVLQTQGTRHPVKQAALSQPGCPIPPAPAPRAGHRSQRSSTCQDLCSGRQSLFQPQGSPQWKISAPPPKSWLAKSGGAGPPKPGHDPP